jgi:hypothetical protein
LLRKRVSSKPTKTKKEIIVMNTTHTPHTPHTQPRSFCRPQSYTAGQIEFIKFLQTHRASLKLTVYDICTVTRKDLMDLFAATGSPYVAIPAWIAADHSRRAGRGNYLIPELELSVSTLTVNTNKRGRKPGSPNRKGRVPALPQPLSKSPEVKNTNAS